MQKQEKQGNIQFITCPACKGVGKNKRGLDCSGCAGLGLGTFFEDKFLYWGLKLGKAVIKLRHLKKSFNLFINLAAYTAGLIGLVALSWWIWQASAQSSSPEAFAFWRNQHWLILIFWISVIADMFILYRLSEEKAFKQKIKKLKYKKKKKEIKLPDNWDELKKINTKRKIDVSRGFSQAGLKVIEEAFMLANNSKHSQIKLSHLFFSLLKDKEVVAIFSRLNVDGKELINKLKKYVSQDLAGQTNLGFKTELSSEVKEVLIKAYLRALKSGLKEVGPMNLILPCLTNDEKIAEILYDLEVDYNKINNVIEWFRINDRLLANYRLYKKMARLKPSSGMDRAYTAVATPALNHFGYDLVRAAKNGRLELCVARDREIESIFQALESGRTGVILVSPPGVGKNAIAGGIAQLMVEEDVPKILKDKRLFELDVARLVSGVTPAQAEERMLVIIDEIIRANNIILYIENIENLMGITAGEEQSLDLSEVLANGLERKNFYCLATATDNNYSKYIEGKPLANAMAKVVIDEPGENQAIQMIESKIGYLEGKYKVYFSYNAIVQAIQLTDKFIHDKYLPAKAIDILESIAVKVAKTKGENALVTKDNIAEIISEVTRIPVTKISETESKALLNLEDKIHQRMIDQDEAIKMVAASLRRARVELREGKKPIANFLFLGPTGVGKTELAKTVAEVYFGKEDYMIRLDMSEYQHQDSVKKMIGSPSSGNLGYLTEAVRKSPYSLILLDEFEKAHADILNLFLQVMDDGRLTDGQGRTIDFTNSIIIATSNVGAVYIQEKIAANVDIEQVKQVLINEHLNKVMRPELINRFDGVIVFNPLSQKDVVEITRLMLNKINKMLETKGISLRAEEEGISSLAKEGYDVKFGARPLRRLLQEKIEDKIANRILNGELKRRDMVVIDANGQVQIEKGREL